MQKRFGDLKRGDHFSLSEGGLVNMKVDPAVLCDEVEHIPFNVVSLETGHPRTFRDDDMVWIVKEAS